MRHPNRKGVTLAELVVVIAIIGAVVLALGPFVQKARERAYRAGCANHLRGIAVAIYKYALAHNGAFPEVTNLSELAQTLSNPNTLYTDDLSLLTCPRTGHQNGPEKDARSATIDYMYANGLRADSPPLAALCADRVRGATLSRDDNHGRSGINVLLVSGDVRWMTAVPNGKWVKE